MTTKPILFLRWKEGWFQTRIMVLPFFAAPPPFVCACGSGCGRRGSYYNRVWQTRISFSLPAPPPPATPRPSFLPPSSSFPCTFFVMFRNSLASVGRSKGGLPPSRQTRLPRRQQSIAQQRFFVQEEPKLFLPDMDEKSGARGSAK